MAIPHRGHRASPSAERVSVRRFACLVTVGVLIHTLMGAIAGEKTTFLYKEVLHLTASQLTVLNLVLGAAYTSHLAGFVAEHWTDLCTRLWRDRRAGRAAAAAHLVDRGYASSSRRGGTTDYGSVGRACRPPPQGTPSE